MKKRNLLDLFHVQHLAKHKRILILPLLAAAMVSPSYASNIKNNPFEVKAFKPDIQITGTVKDTNGLIMPGVSVSLKGGGRTVVTDESGKYSIAVPENSTLIFKYIGFETKEVQVGTNPIINIILETSDTALDQVVVIGYQTIRRKDLTGATGSVNTGSTERLVSRSLPEAL